MTEAIATNNYDILNNAQIGADITPAVKPVEKAAMDSSSNFNNILDKQIYDTQIKTLGDLKNTLQISDMSDKMADFKEFLANATSEANVESSLDLTLARDINDIISQLKGAIEHQENEHDITYDENKDNEVNIEITSLVNEKITPDANNKPSSTLDEIKTNIKNAAPIVFDTVLSLADKAAELDNSGIAKNILDKATEFTNFLKDSEVIVENTEELALETDLEQIDKTSDKLDLNIDKDALKELNIESINSETDTASDNSFMNRQSPEEHSAKIVIGHQIEKFEMPVNTTQTSQAQTNTTDINPSRIIEQITKHLENMTGSKVNIVLNPQALGRINLQIANTQEGLSAQFTVSSNEVRDLLMKGLDGLKEALNAHGVGVDNITVKLNETEKSSYNPDWTDREGSRGGNKDQGQPKHQEKEKGLFEKTIANHFKKNGNV